MPAPMRLPAPARAAAKRPSASALRQEMPQKPASAPGPALELSFGRALRPLPASAFQSGALARPIAGLPRQTGPEIEQCDRCRRGDHRRRFGQRSKSVGGDRLWRADSNDRGALDHRRIEAAYGRINAGAENIGVKIPGAAEHEACNRGSTENMVRKYFTRRFFVLVCRELTGRTRTITHSPYIQTRSTWFLFAAAPDRKFRGSISQRRGASLRRLLVKCRLSTGRSKA